DEVSASRAGTQIWATLTVRNLGSSASGERKLRVSYDKTPLDTRDDPNPAEVDNTYTVPSIPAGGKLSFKGAVTLPAEMAHARVPLYFMLEADATDPNKSNDGTSVVVEATGKVRSVGSLNVTQEARAFTAHMRQD